MSNNTETKKLAKENKPYSVNKNDRGVIIALASNVDRDAVYDRLSEQADILFGNYHNLTLKFAKLNIQHLLEIGTISIMINYLVLSEAWPQGAAENELAGIINQICEIIENCVIVVDP